MNNQDERVREFAYRIWEEEGHPTGREFRHWEQAQEIVRAENVERLRIAVGVDGPEKRSAAKAKPAN
jgi:hypothetical protein